MTEIFPTLSKLLKGLRNPKKKHEFVNYIAEMDYDNFKRIWVTYSDILFKKRIKYAKSRVLSRNWFKYHTIKYYYAELFLLFDKANKPYVTRIMNELDKFTTKLLSLMSIISERQAALEYIGKIDFTLKENSSNKILIILVLMESVYSRDELIKAMNDLRKYRKFI